MLSSQTFNDGFGSDLGGRVRSLRHQRGLTLKALGRLAGLSHPFLSQVERGLARPSVSSVERIAGALGVPVAQLWTAPRAESVQLLRRADAEPGVRRLLAGTAEVQEWSGAGRFPADADAYPGEVLVYCVRGALEVELRETVHALAEGDVLVFDGSIPHRLRRRGGPSTRALIVRA